MNIKDLNIDKIQWVQDLLNSYSGFPIIKCNKECEDENVYDLSNVDLCKECENKIIC